MKSEIDQEKARTAVTGGEAHDNSLHPAWRSFIRYCGELQHGEIDLLKIQDGLPILAEVIKKKVKFAP